MKKLLKNKKAAGLLLSAALIIILVICAVITASHSSSFDKKNFFNTDKEYVEGIDVSSHNGEINWNSVAKSTEFTIIRVGYRGYGTGKIETDSMFEDNIKSANKAKIPAGVYFYSQALTPEEAVEEAKFVLDAIDGYNVDLPVFIDFEYAHGSDGELTGRLYEAKLSSAQSAEIINAFCKKIRDGGYYSGVYSSSSILNFSVKTSSLDDEIYVWVADYNKTVSYLGAYDIWQYSKKGQCDGVNSKYVDVNYWFTNS